MKGKMQDSKPGTLLIKNGIVIDGSGRKGYKADLLIAGDIIREIAPVIKPGPVPTIDAGGLIVAPGFIDAHTHLDFILPAPARNRVLHRWLKMGCTTIVTGNCGFSPAPVNKQFLKDIDIYWGALLPREGLEYEWTTFPQFLTRLSSLDQPLNIVQLIGYNSLLINRAGFACRPLEPEESAGIKKELEEAVTAGAHGLSLGLAYLPAIFSSTAEITAVSKVLRGTGLPLVVHPRGMGALYDKAIAEVIGIGAVNGIPLHLSHHTGGGFSTAYFDRIAEQIARARDSGLEVSGDIIPWANFSSTLFSIFPPLQLAEGMETFFARLADKDARKAMLREIKNTKPAWPPWENGFWTDNYFDTTCIIHGFRGQQNLQYNNKHLAKSTRMAGKDPYDLLCEFILTERQGLCFSYGFYDFPAGERFIRHILRDPYLSVSTDNVGSDLDVNNPASFGAFTKILGTYVREEKLLTLEEAVRRMTSLAAAQFKIEKRGRLEPGYYADIVIFNPASIACNASFKKPERLSTGVEHLLINGRPVLEYGKVRNLDSGRVL